MGPISTLVVAPVRLYQKFISPGLPPTCRYYPSCSSYAIQAVGVHGPIKGMLLAGWRLLRCNPWSYGGVDDVPAKGRWTSDPWEPPDDEVDAVIAAAPVLRAGDASVGVDRD